MRIAGAGADVVIECPGRSVGIRKVVEPEPIKKVVLAATTPTTHVPVVEEKLALRRGGNVGRRRLVVLKLTITLLLRPRRSWRWSKNQEGSDNVVRDLVGNLKKQPRDAQRVRDEVPVASARIMIIVIIIAISVIMLSGLALGHFDIAFVRLIVVGSLRRQQMDRFGTGPRSLERGRVSRQQPKRGNDHA
jgi:hypothetical protein